MEIVKSAADLPDWFKKKTYSKRLSATDWYREIRKRMWVKATMEGLLEMSQRPGYKVDRSHAKSMFSVVYEEMAKDWVCYYQAPRRRPVDDLSKMEAMYISACLDDANSYRAYVKYYELIEQFREEINIEDRIVFSRKYEDLLSNFFNEFADETEPNEDLGTIAVDSIPDELGGIYLSYGSPLHGYPVVIDTDYDDETIIAGVREWLALRRSEDGGKAKRPFSQNDFSDWENYRIREIWDLETWATIHDVRILDKVMAAALWPNAPDGMTPLDFLRTTARKKVKEVLSDDVCHRLYGQLIHDLGENFLSL